MAQVHTDGQEGGAQRTRGGREEAEDDRRPGRGSSTTPCRDRHPENVQRLPGRYTIDRPVPSRSHRSVPSFLIAVDLDLSLVSLRLGERFERSGHSSRSRRWCGATW
jgi:hypothetical protein